jgi:hypothetical protein
MGIARIVVTTNRDIGRSHIAPYLVLRCFTDTALEPLGTDHRSQQVCKNESGHHSSQVNHFSTSNFLTPNKKRVTQAHDRQA